MDGNKFSIIFFYYLNIKYFISFEEEFETLKQNIIEELNIELKEGEKLEIYSYYNELISNQNEYKQYINNFNLKELIVNIKIRKENEKEDDKTEELTFKENFCLNNLNPLYMSGVIETITDMEEIKNRQKELE